MVILFEDIGLSFDGVRRKIGRALFLFIDETERGYRVVGPKGLVLHEPTEGFEEREQCLLRDFSAEQIAAAVRLKLKEHTSVATKNAAALLRSMLQTEFHHDEVYHGPLCERILASIPVTAAIAAAFVSDECEVRYGPGITLRPLFLVVDVKEGAWNNVRYGVFKLSVYDLMKKGYIYVREDDIVLCLRAAKGDVYLDGPTAALKLE